MLPYKRKKNKKRFIALLLAILLCIGFVYFKDRKTKSALPVLKPTERFFTDQNLFTVTVTLTGKESDAALELFYAVCTGLEITPTLFVTTDWLAKHKSSIPKDCPVEFGLLLEPSLNDRTSRKTALLLAEENEKFLTLTGNVPRFVRLTAETPKQNLSSALQSNGQRCIGSTVFLTDEITPGCIVDCGNLNGTTGYLLAKCCSGARNAGYTLLPLSELYAFV